MIDRILLSWSFHMKFILNEPLCKILHIVHVCKNISDIEKNYKVMKELGKLAKTVTDILECRIEAVLEDMSTTALCELPEEEPVTMEQFLEITNEVVNSASKYLAK